jgi:hypothetical protein
MLRRSPVSRWALWVFAAALVLKAAMPWLASASAELQGRTLVEVCSVYGVSLVPVDGGHHDAPATDHHANDHCALTALSPCAGFDSAPAAVIMNARAASPAPRAHPSPQAPDACANWVARLKHGPPVQS